MVFEVGKCYEHSTGTQIQIVGEANTTVWGNCLIAEDVHGYLSPVGRTEDNTVNYVEISKEKWMKNFNK